MTYVIMTDNGAVAEALLDGYGFGDRLLEGVMFRVTIIEGDIRCLGHHANSNDYMKKFSQAQLAEWDEAVVANCRDLGDNLQTEDGEDAWIELVEGDAGDPLSPLRGTVRPIEAESFGAISKRIVGKLTPRQTETG